MTALEVKFYTSTASTQSHLRSNHFQRLPLAVLLSLNHIGKFGIHNFQRFSSRLHHKPSLAPPLPTCILKKQFDLKKDWISAQTISSSFRILRFLRFLLFSNKQTMMIIDLETDQASARRFSHRRPFTAPSPPPRARPPWAGWASRRAAAAPWARAPR